MTDACELYLTAARASVEELFGTMMGVAVTPGARCDSFPRAEVVAVIGLQGRYRGTLALALPQTTLIGVAGAMLGVELTQWDDELAQGAAELANIVVGATKARVTEATGVVLEMGPPAVLAGSDVTLLHPPAGQWRGLEFGSPLGNFSVAIAFETPANDEERQA